jgi:hypothetical protein
MSSRLPPPRGISAARNEISTAPRATRSIIAARGELSHAGSSDRHPRAIESFAVNRSGGNQMPEETAVIANLTAQSWSLHRNYGAFFIPAAGVAARAARGAGDQRTAQAAGNGSGGANAATPTATPSLTRVTQRRAVIDLGDKRTLDVRISARDIADDLCREINGDAGEDSFLGAFVCAGDAPTPAELAAARARLDAFYRRKVAEADREWARSHSHLFLDDLQRRAARELGLEREWNYLLHETRDCPGCGERVKPGVAVCKSCGAILDREKARALGLLHEPVAASTPAPSASRSTPPPVTR